MALLFPPHDGNSKREGKSFDASSTSSPLTVPAVAYPNGHVCAFRVLEAYRRPISVTLRTRLRGEVYSREGQLERVFYSLNEFIVNRGISGVLSTLEVSFLGNVRTQGDIPAGSFVTDRSLWGAVEARAMVAVLRALFGSVGGLHRYVREQNITDLHQQSSGQSSVVHWQSFAIPSPPTTTTFIGQMI